MCSVRTEIIQFSQLGFNREGVYNFKIHCEIFPDEMNIAERVALSEVAISKGFTTEHLPLSGFTTVNPKSMGTR